MKARGRRWDTQRESMRRGEERRGWAVSPESYNTPNNYNCRFIYLLILLLSLEGEKNVSCDNLTDTALFSRGSDIFM